MQGLVIAGLVLVTAALAALGYCVREGFAARRLEPAAARARLARVAAVNLGALAAAGLGLGLVTLGLLL